MNITSILFSFSIFAILMVAFGQATGVPGVTNTLNEIFAPIPSLQDTIKPVNTSCGFLDGSCIANSVATATWDIAVAILWPSLIGYAIVSRALAFVNLVMQIMLSPQASFASIPFGILFFAGFVVVIAIDIFKLIRGNAIAGV